MAFLCPVRIRRSKQQPNKNRKIPADHVSEYLEASVDGPTPGMLGRITGSSSIETLVRVGLEKEAAGDGNNAARMIVVHDFDPCVDDELEVKRGTVVTVLYRENDWVYVIADKGREGFIPHSYCSPLESKPDVVAQNKMNNNSTSINTISSSGSSKIQSQEDGSVVSSDIHPFYKDPAGQYIVLYKFTARDENDVNVERGELITVLNKDDPDWFWMVRSDGQEGFVPSAFVFPLIHQQATSHESPGSNAKNTSATLKDENKPMMQHGTELVMLYDYKAQAPDDLSVKRGDWVYADMNHQTVEGWLWSYAPKQKKYGFIPKAYARPPAMTSL